MFPLLSRGRLHSPDLLHFTQYTDVGRVHKSGGGGGRSRSHLLLFSVSISWGSQRKDLFRGKPSTDITFFLLDAGVVA